jgi:hypothetical protein
MGHPPQNAEEHANRTQTWPKRLIEFRPGRYCSEYNRRGASPFKLLLVLPLTQDLRVHPHLVVNFWVVRVYGVEYDIGIDGAL